MARATVAGSIQLHGFREFSRALKATGDEYPAALKRANYDLADVLVTAAKAKAGSLPGVAGKAARSLRATKTANYAAVSGGGARYPYFYGAEFGSHRYKQFQSWRGNQWGGWNGGPGYFLHPAIRENGMDAIKKYMERLDEIHAQAFPG